MAKSNRPKTQCPGCMKVLKIKHKGLYGRKTICPKCEIVFTLEPLAEFEAETAEDVASRPNPSDGWDDFGDLDNL